MSEPPMRVIKGTEELTEALKDKDYTPVMLVSVRREALTLVDSGIPAAREVLLNGIARMLQECVQALFTEEGTPDV